MDFFEIKKDGSTRSDAVNKSTQRTWTEVLPAGIVSTGDKIGLHVMAKNKNGDIIGEYVATNYNDALLDNFKPVLNLQNPVINGTRGTYTVTSIPREVLNTKTGKVEVKNMRQVFISDAKIG